MSPTRNIVLHNMRDALEVFRLDEADVTFLCKIPCATKKRYTVRPVFLACEVEGVLCNSDDNLVYVWKHLTGETLCKFAIAAGKLSSAAPRTMLTI